MRSSKNVYSRVAGFGKWGIIDTIMTKEKQTEKKRLKPLMYRLCFAALELLCQYGCTGTVTEQEHGKEKFV